VGTTRNVKLEYTTDGGVSWILLSSSLSGTSYAWSIVPSTPSTNCRVRITDVSVAAALDSSNSTFTIAKNTDIVVTSPNGGETLQAGTTQNITWTASGTYTNLKLEYSTNSGSTWTRITSVLAVSGSYAWAVPNVPSATCLIRLTDTTNTCKTDVSNATFTISAPTRVITVTSPNTAVTWYAYSSYNVTWTSQYLTSTTVTIEYSINGGTTWNTITTSASASTRSYTWTIPNLPSSQCRVRVSETGNIGVNDISDVNFTIAPPLITVTSPDTAATYYVGNTLVVNWTNTTLSGTTVKLDYSIDNGVTWLPIVPSINNTGSYTWPIPNTPSSQCRVRVSDALNASFFDISNVNFTIAPAIIITNPNVMEIVLDIYIIHI
jgi:hypothetical protein